MVKLDGIVFFDSVVLLGTAEVNQTKKPLQFIGYKVDGANTWLLQTIMICQPNR
jgi:hypothetical protein